MTRCREIRIEYWRQDLNDGLLNQTIEHVWNAEQSLAAICLSIVDADAASSGRTVDPVVFTLRLPGNLPAGWREGFPRVKSSEGSSLFFIVRSFVLSLELTAHYYDLC